MTSNTENYRNFKSFFSQEYHSLKAYVNSKIKAAADRDAEDIIQDVALKIFSGVDSLNPIDNIASFVYHAIKNKIIDVMRLKKQQISIEDEHWARWKESMPFENDEIANAYSDDLQSDLLIAITKLKPYYKEVIMAIDFEGFSYREFSEFTGIAEGTLMSRRHRAMSQLYKTLSDKKQTNI